MIEKLVCAIYFFLFRFLLYFLDFVSGRSNSSHAGTDANADADATRSQQSIQGTELIVHSSLLSHSGLI